MKQQSLLTVIAGINALIGFLTLGVVFKLLGVGQEADLWLLANAMIATLAMVAQGGVEQFPVFYAERLSEAGSSADGFLRGALVWALISGAGLAMLSAASAELLVWLFSSGLTAESRGRLIAVFTGLSPLIAIAPSIYVVRQTLALRGRFISSASVGLLLPTIQLSVMLCSSLAIHVDLRVNAWLISLISLAAVTVATWLVGRSPGRKLVLHNIFSQKFISNSMQMRFAHSAHNLLFSVIVNNALSHLSTGTISEFQYAKRLADGLSAVSMGPAAGVYHANQTLALISRNVVAFRHNVSMYLAAFVPAFCLILLTSMLVLHASPRWSPGLAGEMLWDIAKIYALLAAWQFLIGIETIAVGVLNVGKKAATLLLVNLIFVGLLEASCVTITSSSFDIALTLIAAQSVSVALFTAAATRQYRRHFRDKR